MMRTTLLILLLVTPLSGFAWNELPQSLRHNIVVQPNEKMESYPTLVLDKLPVSANAKYVPGWKYPLHNINRVSAIIKSDDGYYIAGTVLNSGDINVSFDRGLVDDIFQGKSKKSQSSEDLFEVNIKKDIQISLIHLSHDGNVVWATTFENDLVTSGAMTLLPDSRILLALIPPVIDFDESFSSFLFVISKEGEIERRVELKDQLVNSLFTTSSGEILAGVVKREMNEERGVMTLRQYASFYDENINKINEITIAGHPGRRQAYEVLSIAKEYDDAYILSGGDKIVTLNKEDLNVTLDEILPDYDKGTEYYINQFNRDSQDNLTILGFYGRAGSPLAEMQYNYLQSVSRPTVPGQELSPSTRKLAKNPMLRMIYDEILSDFRGRTTERGDPFHAVLAKDGNLINIIDKDQGSKQHAYTGAVSKDGLFLIERIKNREQKAYYLLNSDSKLLLRGKSLQPFCNFRCNLFGSTLLNVRWDNDLQGFVMQQGEFQIDVQEDSASDMGMDDQSAIKVN